MRDDKCSIRDQKRSFTHVLRATLLLHSKKCNPDIQNNMLHTNYDITDLTGYKIPAKSHYFVNYHSPQDISDVLSTCSICISKKLPVLVLSS